MINTILFFLVLGTLLFINNTETVATIKIIISIKFSLSFTLKMPIQLRSCGVLLLSTPS